MTNEYDLLLSLLERVKKLKFRDFYALDDIMKKGKMALENLFPAKPYSINIGRIKFQQIHINEISIDDQRDEWAKGQGELINLLDTAIKDYEFQLSKTPDKSIPDESYDKDRFQQELDTYRGKLKDCDNQLHKYKKDVKNWIVFTIGLILFTGLFWIFYLQSNWNWFNNHSHKLAITLESNLTITAILLFIRLGIKRYVWLPMIIGILAVLFSLI